MALAAPSQAPHSPSRQSPETSTHVDALSGHRGVLAGLCIAFVAIIADRLIGACAARRKKETGIAS